MSKACATADDQDALGRLREFGIDEPWQAALLLPRRWDDFTQPEDSCSAWQLGQSVVIVGLVCEKPSVNFTRRPPRSVIRVSLPSGDVVRAMVFGDVEKVVGKLRPGSTLVMRGEVKSFGDQWWLGNPCIAGEAWANRLRPVYPGKPGRIGADLVRLRVHRLLREAVPIAADWIAQRLAGSEDMREILRRIGAPSLDLAEVLRWAHVPPSLKTGQRAQEALEALAAADVLRTVEAHRQREPAQRLLKLPTLRARAMQIPFRLTPSQCAAISEVATLLRGTDVVRHTISGEVASGKTAVYGTLAAAIADELMTAGEPGCVAILLPNQNLATQIAKDFATWWPDIPIARVTADSQADLTNVRLAIGTTALINRNLPVPALVVVDEQHKLSTGQREALVSAQCHSIDVSATCIPRTTALVQYGAMGVTRLEKGPAERAIQTRLWAETDARKVFAGVRDTVRAGDNVLVIYPSIEANEASNLKTSIHASLGRWERQFPGKVRSIHSQRDPVSQAQALHDVAGGRAQILISSTIIEVGVNIPRLRRVVVVYPERFSANVLHQIRGRLAREGGFGHFDMLPIGSIPADTRERLEVLVRHTDGFSVAEADLELRGFGDLAIGSGKQSGLNDSFLVGRPIGPAAVRKLLAT